MKKRGFTLVELLVVLALGVSLLAIAVPGYGFLVNSSRLTALTNDLVGALRLTRLEAIKRGKWVTVCKTGNPMAAHPGCNNSAHWHDGWLMFVDGGTRGVREPGDTLLRVHGPSPAGAEISANSFHQFISYRASGISRGSNGLGNGTIQVCLAGKRRDIVISMTGRIRLNSGDC